MDTHFHKCRNRSCGVIWEHPDSMAGNKEAHRCPDCGRYSYVRHALRWWQRVKYPAEKLNSDV